MTIKTLKATSSCGLSTNSNAISSDMPNFRRTGAARNLFNTTVDRDELQKQLNSLESKNSRELDKYKFESKISEIRRNDDHQARRLKYMPAKEVDSKRQAQKSTSQSTLHSMILSRDASSSSTSFYKSSLPSSSKMLSVQKTATSTNPALPKGQRTIKDYYQSVKRSRENR